jgi:hypothetical protein
MKQMLNQKLNSIDILNIFINQHRLFSQFDPEIDIYAEFDFNSTVKDWSDANDLIQWDKLYLVYNQEFKINATREEWEAVLVPASKKKLIDVCEFIAAKATYPNIQSVKILGNESLEAGVFKTLMDNLTNKNVKTQNIKPSSKISDFLDEYMLEIITEVIFLSKGSTFIKKIEKKRRKKGILNSVNVFEKDRFVYYIPDINTFKELILKIIEVRRDDIFTSDIV